MREQVLRDFFEGRSSAAELERDVAGSTKGTGPRASVVSIEDMDKDFVVTADMAVRLCEAVLRGELLPDTLHTIGFALMASDRFQWDGQPVGPVRKRYSRPQGAVLGTAGLPQSARRNVLELLRTDLERRELSGFRDNRDFDSRAFEICEGT